VHLYAEPPNKRKLDAKIEQNQLVFFLYILFFLFVFLLFASKTRLAFALLAMMYVRLSQARAHLCARTTSVLSTVEEA
jgi:hypothetical protein